MTMDLWRRERDRSSTGSGVSTPSSHVPVGGLPEPWRTPQSADAKAQLETLFWGTVRVVQTVLPGMRANKSGRIVFSVLSEA